MAQQMGNQPLIVMSEDAQRTSGQDARDMNVSAARAIAESVRTTLGPKGMDKMLLDGSGSVVITNDGATLLDEMEVDHPAADMIVEVAESQEEDVGDGTTTAVVLAGELLKSVEDLIEDVHPTTIIQGYRRAAEEAEAVLEDLATPLDPDDTDTLERIANTAITGKGADTDSELLADLVVRGVRAAYREDGTVDHDAVAIESFVGKSISESQFIEGVTVDINPPHENMPTAVEDANVLVYEGDIEISELELDAEATVTSPDQLEDLVGREEGEIQEAVDRIVDAGADVVLVDGGIDDRAQGKLAREGVLALRRVDEEYRERVASATGASRVSDLATLTSDDLGHAGHVERERIRTVGRMGDVVTERTLVFRDLPTGEVGTIFLRGSTEHVVDELERTLDDAIQVVASALEDGAVLPGGGAPEIELALALRDLADGVEGRQQLAIEAFADAVEVGPRTLAENAGHDPIDSLVELRAAHADGQQAAGLDAETGDVTDMMEAGVVEPLRVKRTAVDAATSAATMLLRIDDVISAGDLSTAGDDDEEGGAPGGGMGGGMGGMGGGMGGMM